MVDATTTPRSVGRALNALSLVVPDLQGTTDLPDLVWLQLVRADNPKLYRWIEEYCANAAAMSSKRARVSDDEKRRSFAELKKILGDDGIDFEGYRYELADHLAGIGTPLPLDDANPPIHMAMSANALRQAIGGKRLASPDHYRLYFALAQPALAPTSKDFDNLSSAATQSDEAVAALLLEWCEINDPTIGTKTDLVIDRLKQHGVGARR